MLQDPKYFDNLFTKWYQKAHQECKEEEKTGQQENRIQEQEETKEL